MSAYTVTDGNCRLVVDTDPGTHRLRVTMEELPPGGAYATSWWEWEPLGCVSMDPERATELANVLSPQPVSAGIYSELHRTHRNWADCRHAAGLLQAELDGCRAKLVRVEQELDAERARRKGTLR